MPEFTDEFTSVTDIRAAAMQIATDRIAQGFHPIRAFNDAVVYAQETGTSCKVNVAIVNYTIGNMQFDQAPITEREYAELNEELGIVPGTETYRQISQARAEIEIALPRGYRSSGGLESTRATMSAHLSNWGLEREVGNSIFCAGAAQGLALAMLAAKRYFKEKDAPMKTLFPIPGFTPTMLAAVDLTSKEDVIPTQCTGEHFNLTAGDIDRTFQNGLSPNLLILTPVSNPMGIIADPEQLIPAVERFIELSPDGVIILDWAYLMLNAPNNSTIAKIIDFFNRQEIREKCIEVVSFSKGTGDPGRRQCIVYASSGEGNREKSTTLWTHLSAVNGIINPSSPRATEAEALAYSTHIPHSVILKLGKLMEMRTYHLAAVLRDSEFFSKVIPPEGTLYVMARLDPNGPITNAEELFIQTGAAAVDASAFGVQESGWVRFSVGNVTMDTITKFARSIETLYA